MASNLRGRVDGRSLRLAGVFVLVTSLLLAALAAIAWRQIDVERAVDADRLAGQVANAAALLTDEVERRFVMWERTISEAARSESSLVIPDEATLVYCDETGVTRTAGVPLPFYPAVPVVTPADFPMLDTIESLEYARGDLAAAEAAYLGLTSSPDSRLRAEALMGLARIRRKQKKHTLALSAYETLASLHHVSVNGMPAELVAYRGRAAIFDDLGDRASGIRERARLDSALLTTRHVIDRATFDALRAPGAPPFEAASALHLATAVEAFWADWQMKPAGRSVRRIGDQAWVSTWHAASGLRGALVAPAETVEVALRASASALGVDVALVDPLAPSGAPGESPAPTVPALARPAHETGLPWTLVVRPNKVRSSSLGVRSGTLIAGLLLMTLVIGASGYFVFRAVNREVGVAQLQSDFVSAVSHEFRSPLTAMSHLTDLLEDGDAGPERQRAYHQALGRETRRLHGLVETLLDFGRIEAGGRTYSRGSVDLAQLLRDVVAEITARDATAATRIRTGIPSQPALVTADADALAIAIRNLIDNALKYSPADTPVRVVVSTDAAHVTLAVEDRGPGLTALEQRQIFGKFVRGSAARELGVKGTGIGLTMAKYLVVEQGGTILLESEPGRGSRFALVLPVKE